MTLRKTVGSLAHGAVTTAVSVARHPLGSASMASGLVKGTPEAGLDLVRGTVAAEKPDPRDNIPGPDLAAFAPPAPEDLPEPIVIEGEPPTQEAFHTEPKAASRGSEHGGPAAEREEIEGYLGEIVTDA